jgi:paraquat-inducible protein B
VKNPALAIGGFVVAALVLAVGGVLWLSGSHLFERQVKAVIYFKGGVAGLYKGAPVTFRGVPLGQVESIGLEVDPKTRTARIPVHVRLSTDVVTIRGSQDTAQSLPNLQEAVRDGLRAKLVSQSLVTGQKSIELNIVPDAPPVVLVPGALLEIPAMADRFDSIEGQLADLPLRDVVQELRSTMSALRATMATADATLVSASATLVAAGREIGAVGLQARQTMTVAGAALVRVQGNADLALASVTRLADNADGTVTAIRPDLVRTISEARAAVESAHLAMSRVAELTAPDAPLRSDLDGAVADLAQATRGLRDWSDLLQEQPNAIIFGRRGAAKGQP